MPDSWAMQRDCHALLLELPQREIGGQLPAWTDLQAQSAWARNRGVAVHLDGARLWKSAAFYGRPYSDIAALAGDSAFITEARGRQQRHDGNLVQLYPLVLSSRVNLRRRRDKFASYHQRACQVSHVLSAIQGISVKPDPPHTNMMHVYLRGSAEVLLDASAELARTERVCLFRRLIPTGVPGVAAFELTVGDATEFLTGPEIADSFTRADAGASVNWISWSARS